MCGRYYVDDRDAGKFRRYSFDFTIVNVQSGIETGMDITKKTGS